MNQNTVEDTNIELAVQKGIAWLDENHPDWENRINTEKLKMRECSTCVLGQAVGDYYSTLVEVGGYDSDGEKWAVEHGFQAPEFWDGTQYNLLAENTYYHTLDQLWTGEILKRRSK